MVKQKLVKLFSFLFIIIFLCIFGYVIYSIWNPLKTLFSTGNDTALREALSDFGFWRYAIIAVLHMIQVLLSVMPAEPIQLLAGVVCPPVWAFISCLTGVALGNTILYVIVRLFDVNPDINTKKDKYSNYSNLNKINEENSIRTITFIILGMYFTPVIPYGVIAYSAIKAKMKYFRYIIITTLGTIPSIALCLAASNILVRSPMVFETYFPTFLVSAVIIILGLLVLKFRKKIIDHVLKHSIRSTIIWVILALIISICLSVSVMQKKFSVSIIIFMLLIILIICYAVFDRSITKIFTRKKMDYFQKHVRTPNAFVYNLFAFFIKIYFFTKYRVKVNKNGIKKLDTPSVLLFNHPSKLDFIYSFIPILPQKVNVAMAYYYFCNFHLGRLIHTLGAFPKYLYQPDISAIKNMKTVIKNNGILALAPEGRLSAYGEMESFIPSTAKLLKNLDATVYLSSIRGAYFSNPKWSFTSRRGKVEVEYTVLFTKEELSILSVDEIYQRINERLNYGEHEWIEKNNVLYKGRHFAEGLEQILYLCPVCHHEYTYSSNKDVLTCSHCHTKVRLSPNYQLLSENNLIPKNIKLWYEWQKEVELNNIQDPNYILESPVTLKFPDPKGLGFTVVGSGKTILTHEGIRYIGTINGEEQNILFPLAAVPALPFGVLEDFEIYHHNTLYYFIPENIRQCVKWSVVEEQMYLDYVKKNNIKLW